MNYTLDIIAISFLLLILGVANIPYVYGKKIKENKGGSILKCPNCDTWTSETYSTSKVKDHPKDSDAFILVCGECKHSSTWNTSIAPFPVRLDDKGNPVF